MKSEENTPKAATDSKGRVELMAPQTRNLLVGTALAIVLLTITAWAGTVRTESAKQETLLSGVAALAASLKYPMLEANSMRTDAGRERLGPILSDISKAGGYSAIVLTDDKGAVLATTKGSAQGEKVDVDTLPKEGPRVVRSEPGLVGSSPILVGDTVLGYLIVETTH
jgi:hypothetical protein